MNKDNKIPAISNDFFHDETPSMTNNRFSDETILDTLSEVEIDPAHDIAPPSICLYINSAQGRIPIATAGNISLIIGKAKSRKTFFISLALAAAIGNQPSLNIIEGNLPEQTQVLFFDTEQGRYHAQKSVRRMCQLAGIPKPTNFKAYGLRKFTPAQRLKLISAAIEQVPRVAFIVIDGIRDLVTSINDEEQATMMSSHLLKWTEELDLHIMVVLHQNKSDTNPRGHLGTELMNKAETVLSVTKEEKNGTISIVEPEHCRDKAPEPFAFMIDEQGLPRLIGDWQPKRSNATGNDPITVLRVPDEKHKQVLFKTFGKAPRMLYHELQTSIKAVMMSDLSLSIGNNKLREFIHYYLEKEWLVKNVTDNTKEKFYALGVLTG